LAVFLGAAGHFLNEGRYLDYSRRFLKRSFDWVRLSAVPRSLFHGYTGCAWASSYLGSLSSERFRVVGIGDVNSVLLSSLRSGSVREDELDLLGGLAGIGLYALACPDEDGGSEIVEEILRRLDESATRSDQGVYWTAPRSHFEPDVWERYSHGVVNLGAAHGLPGFIAFLAGASARHAASSGVAQGLLSQATRWLCSHRQAEAKPSRFPPYVGVTASNHPLLHEKDRHARLAWCYGDAGVHGVLSWTNSVWKCDRDLQVRSLFPSNGSGFPDTRPEVDPTLKSPCLCHGVAGVVHSLTRALERRREYFDLGCWEVWIDHLVSMRGAHGFGYGGYAERFWDDSTGTHEWIWLPSPGFLAGSAGIGLALLSVASTEARGSGWDAVLGFCQSTTPQSRSG
jgi:lantibiotic biosynthesis protein